MSHDVPSLEIDDLRDVLIRSGNSHVEDTRDRTSTSASRHERSFHNRALRLKIMQPSSAPPRLPLDHYLKPSSGIGQERLSVNRGPTRRQSACTQCGQG